MTMVLKNSGMAAPEQNVGATLFIYKARNQIQPDVGNDQNGPSQLAIQDTDRRGRGNQMGGVNGESSNQRPAPPDLEECKARIDKSAEDARKSRERKLMAHLGLKG